MSITITTPTASAFPLLAPVTVHCLTPRAVALLTGLTWVEVTDVTLLPKERGVYVLAPGWEAGVHYTGAANGVGGLRRRVGDEGRWQREHAVAFAAALGSGLLLIDDDVTDQSPLIRVAAERGLRTWVAVAEPASWADQMPDDERAPVTTREWERVIMEMQRILTGHRGLLGAGAWETKPGSMGAAMARAAWRRLQWAQQEGFDVTPQVTN